MNTCSTQPGRRAATADRIRTALLDAAEGLLAQHRPGAVTSRDLARHAGVSAGVLYNHFADKHDLLLTALVRRFGLLLDAYLAIPMEAGPGSTAEALGLVDLRPLVPLGDGPKGLG